MYAAARRLDLAPVCMYIDYIQTIYILLLLLLLPRVSARSYCCASARSHARASVSARPHTRASASVRVSRNTKFYTLLFFVFL